MTRSEYAAQKFIENLRKIRKEKKISQQHMGNVLKVHQSAVSRIEKGEQGLELWQVIRVCEYFDTRLEDLCS